ncbi:MAG: EAL domain-containing protein [Spirochaetales bacterium]|nr:EAL domain-containing protein [Spirochaetales bacterium]
MSKKSGNGTLTINNAGTILEADESISGLLGYTGAQLVGSALTSHLTDTCRKPFEHELARIVTGEIQTLHLNTLHAKSFVLPLELTLVQKTEDHFQFDVFDLSRRSDLESELDQVRDHYMLLSESTTDVILQIDNHFNIVYVNSAVTSVLGVKPERLLHESLEIIFPKSQYSRYRERIYKYFVIDDIHRSTKGLGNVIEALARKAGGELIPVEISMGNSRGIGDDRILTCIIRDISLRKKADRRLRYLAFHDKLTSLGNRDRFAESLTRVLNEMTPESGKSAALLYLDLDGFKKINDSLGHEIGDAILKACAKRLGNCLRDGDQVYRFDFEEIFRVGGDEFTILLPYISNPEDASIVAKRVIDTLTQPFSVEGWESIKNIRLGVSIGIALIPRDGRDRTALLRNADAAMYRAKERGNSYEFFTEEMNDMAMERLLMEEGIRQALSWNQFELYYQPVVDANGKICSVEALIRWNHPKHGILPPDRFIPLAEDMDLMKPLGTWVLSAACRELHAFQSRGYPELVMCVNIAPSQLEQRDLCETIGNILARHNINPRHLRLEITESSIMENPERSRQRIDLIKSMHEGITVAIDDFGTGYSSLAYLTRYAVDYLKIDKSFVMQMHKSENSKVVKTIIDLGFSLGLEIVAEGVETAEQFAELRRYGCHYFQGYYKAMPLSSSAFDKLLERDAREQVQSS